MFAFKFSGVSKLFADIEYGISVWVFQSQGRAKTNSPRKLYRTGGLSNLKSEKRLPTKRFSYLSLRTLSDSLLKKCLQTIPCPVALLEERGLNKDV